VGRGTGLGMAYRIGVSYSSVNITPVGRLIIGFGVVLVVMAVL